MYFIFSVHLQLCNQKYRSDHHFQEYFLVENVVLLGQKIGDFLSFLVGFFNKGNKTRQKRHKWVFNFVLWYDSVKNNFQNILAFLSYLKLSRIFVLYVHENTLIYFYQHFCWNLYYNCMELTNNFIEYYNSNYTIFN